MKTRITLITAVLLLQANIIFASNDITTSPSIPAVATTSIMTLSPTTPTEATFEDESIEIVSTLILAPETPATADFDDEVNNADNSILAPAAPSEADFE